MTGWLRAALAGSLALLGGCATTPPAGAPASAGATSWRMADTPDTEHYALAMGEVAFGATPLRRVAPIYPPSLLQQCPPPLEQRALLIVGVDGTVREVRVEDEATADPTRRSLIAAVRAAARQWTFSPLLKERWAADAEGNSHVVDTATLPFSRSYVFRFQCEHGRGSVTAGKRAAGPEHQP